MVCLFKFLYGLVGFVRGNDRGTMLTPYEPEVIEHRSLTLSCIISVTPVTSNMYWKLNNRIVIVHLTETECRASGHLLNRTDLYTLRCVEGNVSLTIMNVDREQHGDTWQCLHGFTRSNIVHIFVIVPVQTVNISLPNGNVIEENQTLLFHCVTSYSRPSPVIYWSLNNGTPDFSDDIRIHSNINESYANTTVGNNAENILTSTTSELIYKVQSSFDRHKIYCSANVTSKTSVKSAKVTLNITYPPDGPPYIRGFGIGETYNVINELTGHMSCIVTGGNPLPKLNWNCAINGSQNSNISKTTVTNDFAWLASRYNTGTCTCQSKYKDMISSVTININVMYSPENITFLFKYPNGTLVSVPDHVSVIEHTEFALTCLASGNPPPFSYSWSGSFSSTDKTLHVQDVNRSHAGIFTCSANNRMQPSSGNPVIATGVKNIFISVLFPPEVGKFEVKNISEGSALDVTCPFIPGNPAYTRFKWTNEDNKEWRGQLLSIKNVSRKQDGEYACTVYNDMLPTAGAVVEGTTNRSFHLNVLYKASVKHFYIERYEKQRTITVNEGSNIRFHCDVDTNPGSTITLYFLGQKEVFKLHNVKTLSYLQENVTCLHAGFYTCTGINDLNKGQPSIEILLLQIRCSPRSTNTVLTTVYAPLNGSAILSFTALAYPEPGPSGFKWHKLYGSKWIPLATSKEHDISTSQLKSNFTIASVTDSDYGKYKLRIENAVGTFEQIFILFKTVEDFPDGIEGKSSPVISIVIGCCLSVLVITIASGFLIHKCRRYQKKKDRVNDRTSIVQSLNEVSEMKTIAENCNNISHIETADRNETVYEEIKPYKDRDIADRMENRYDNLKQGSFLETDMRRSENHAPPFKPELLKIHML